MQCVDSDVVIRSYTTGMWRLVGSLSMIMRARVCMCVCVCVATMRGVEQQTMVAYLFFFELVSP